MTVLAPTHVVTPAGPELPFARWSCARCGIDTGQVITGLDTPAEAIRDEARWHISWTGHSVDYSHGMTLVLHGMATEPPVPDPDDQAVAAVMAHAEWCQDPWCGGRCRFPVAALPPGSATSKES